VSGVRLWDYALAIYGQPGVEAVCLDLQDTHRQCVSLLLWRLWALAEGRPVDAALLTDAAAAARAWDDAALTPLRQVGRELKRRFPPIPDAARNALRQELKSAELLAERVLLETLDALTPDPDSAQGERAAALAETALAWGAAAPMASLTALAAAAL
jgi:uncharacterized protein (TIGR02444 family)